MHAEPTAARSTAWRARPVRRAWCASDMHLHGGDSAGVERACRFVAAARADGADALFLLGDIFRAWVGPRSLDDPGLAPFLAALRAAVEGGVRVTLTHGNHDFLMGAHLGLALGVEVCRESVDVALGGSRARLLHGDRFCTNDVGYHRLHRVLRAAPVRAALQALPAAVQQGLAGALLSASRHATAAKTSLQMGIVDAAVARELATGLDVIVCGHVHTARDARFDVGGRSARLLVMADFERSGCHARFAGETLALVRHDARFAHPEHPARGPVIAIDGPAGSGKSSVSRALARRLGFRHLNSGALYRAVTARALAAGLAPHDPAVAELARRLDLVLDADGGVRVDGVSVPEEVLRSPEVSAQVSPMSADPALREALLAVQRRVALGAPGVVAEGRDMGSVIFPEAELRIYLDADAGVRAARRLAESAGEGLDAGAVQAALAARDRADSSRAHAPLQRADGALLLDTTALTLEQVVDRIEALLRG
jgi:CMP/dCMP kinase